MSANDQMQGGIAEATRLTRQGRLDEATAAIQSALGGTFVPPKEPVSSDGTDGPIDVTSRIVRRTRQGPGRRTAGHRFDAATRPAPSPNLLNHGVGTPLGTRMAKASYV